MYFLLVGVASFQHVFYTSCFGNILDPGIKSCKRDRDRLGAISSMISHVIGATQLRCVQVYEVTTIKNICGFIGEFRISNKFTNTRFQIYLKKGGLCYTSIRLIR